MFSLNFMFFCSLIEELCTKEENYKTSCSFSFGHECTFQFDVCFDGILNPYFTDPTMNSDFCLDILIMKIIPDANHEH